MTFAGKVLCCCGCAVVGIELHPGLQYGARDPEQPVGDAAQGTTIGVTAPAQGIIAAAAFGVVLDSHASPVEHGLAQSALHGTAYDDAA